MKKNLVYGVILSLFLSACSLMVNQINQQDESADAMEPAYAVPSSTPLPTATDSAAAYLPQAVSFTAQDGETISGLFYPPARENAPVVVLMHQVNLDMHEWDAIAPWLQNAPGIPPYARTEGQTDVWLDPSWFPSLPKDFTVGVLVFTFRGCEGGCKTRFPDEWIMDAEGALVKAASLPGVDRTRIVAIGTSIGADAAADACSLTTPLSSLRCAGVFSLSPGSFLNMPYATTARNLAELGLPVMCFATSGDTQSADACHAVEQANFTAYVDKGSQHGIEMLYPTAPTQILEVIRDFLLGL